ncbi:hypothetical protein [Usitatibacter palustris]|uniref:IPT/TIG domain-containing protein n=1 Tax=Usitatibacter palustris TaxID=2732487 RepID=A0A6M4HB56_9PROT|nr:hypothetical protein [Usitatibacter palustris]QJR16920.1 hypothetical protein DSM104440_03757 [Usitatibacter palustris]
MKLVAAVLAVASSVLLASCGGGGAATTQEGGILRIQPDPGTFYAGVPNEILISGGRMPYTMSSSDPTVLAIPATVNSGSIMVIPNNPGVVDPGLQPNEVPRRTVTVAARDVNGLFYDAAIAVLQNFLTGYGSSIVSTCPAPSAGAAVQACPGRESIITAVPVSQGTLYGLRTMRFEVIRGSFQFVVPETPSNPTRVLVNQYTIPTDHEGKAIARIYVAPNAGTQLATFRLTDVQSGVYVDTIFTISQAAGTIVAIPSELEFTAALATRCGTGSSQVYIFDGIPPYTATSTSIHVSVFPNSPNTNPGVFTVAATNDSVCGTFPVIFQDATGARVTVVVTTSAGSGTLPAMTIAPTAHTIGCASSASSTIIGGAGGYSVNSSDPSRVTAVVSGNTITFTRTGGPLGSGGNVSIPVTVTDGTTLTTVTVTVPATCT